MPGSAIGGDEMDGVNEKTERPGTAFLFVITLVSLAAAMLVPELGVFGVIAAAGGVMYVASSRANVFLIVLASSGMILCSLRGDGIAYVGASAIVGCALVAGIALGLGKSFHVALMAFVASAAFMAIGGAAFVFGPGGVNLSDVPPLVEHKLLVFVQTVISASPNALTEDQATALINMYKNLSGYIVLYIPAMVGVAAGVFGVITLRLCGLIHTISGDGLYPMCRRRAVVSRTFAIFYLIATFLFVAGGDGIVGIAAGNIVIFLLVPAAAAGVTAFRRDLAPGARLSRFRALFILLSVIFVFVSPGLIVILLSLLGVFAAFGKAPGEDGKEGSAGE